MGCQNAVSVLQQDLSVKFSRRATMIQAVQLKSVPSFDQGYISADSFIFYSEKHPVSVFENVRESKQRGNIFDESQRGAEVLIVIIQSSIPPPSHEVYMGGEMG